ncbi:MAG TPA: ABC transporter permease, partial [Candidatus Acidoferrales bacterium]|nr:ABC transporter permease [Candidatus Acidoferrales bacterium]
METLLQDVRYALRMLRKSPGFALVAVLTLALGIGANTAIFSVVNAVLLRPLAYPESERLVFLTEWTPLVPYTSISMADFNDWRAMSTVFESMTAYQTNNVVLSGTGESERLRERLITASYFPTTRIRPVLGRELAPEDDRVGAERVVLLGDGFWARKFGRDPKVLGQTLILDGEPYTVIGVLPNGQMHGPWQRMDVFASLWRLEDRIGGPTRRDEHPGIYGIGRLKPGVTLEQARAELKSIASRLAQKYPDTNERMSAEAFTLLGAYVDDVRPPLLALLAAVGLVLLIACANIANLLLARATERSRELAVRRALGAGAWRLVRQSLTESLVLALAGSVLGLLLAAALTRGFGHLFYAAVPRLAETSLDRTVMFFALGLTVFTALFFGILPAMQSSRADVQQALQEGGRSGMGRSTGRLRSALVVGELAISLVLLAGAGLMSKSLYRMMRADAGFNPSHLLTASFTLPDVPYQDEAKSRAFIREVVEKAEALPGVDAAGFKSPLLGGWQTSFYTEGRPMPPLGHFPSTDMSRLTPDAFRAMGIRLLRGRYFEARDTETAPRVCIVDETLAAQTWPGEDPVGKRMSVDGPPRAGEEPRWRTVVGVVAHVKNYGVDQPSRFETYVPNEQRPGQGGALIIRTSANPTSLAGALRSIVNSVDAGVPVFDLREMEEIVAENTAPRRLSAELIAAFAGLALLLAAVGIYGVISCGVTQRAHEIGVRMAVGAQRGDILRLVVGQGARVAGIGLVAGLIASVGMGRVLSGLLFQVSPFDPEALGGVSVLLLVVALTASYLPARRAARTDPIVTLR